MTAATEPQRDLHDVDHGQLAGIIVLCIDNDLALLDGMQTLLEGWGCIAHKAPDLATGLATVECGAIAPEALLVDYHLDDSNGVVAIEALRRRFGTGLPAILITADRSPRVREEARVSDIQLLNKPIKPAALRALLAQCRVQRVAAAE
jgi:CheY-like chemotaxis protein